MGGPWTWRSRLAAAPAAAAGLLALVLGLAGNGEGAQAATRVSAAPMETVRFQRFGMAEGLSQSSAIDLLQDRRGYLWIATQDGLNRYDGNGFRVYRHDEGDSASLPDSYVLCLAEASDGSLWVGTQNGLARYLPELDRFESFPLAAATDGDSVVVDLLAWADGPLWVSLRSGKVLRVQPGHPAVVLQAPVEAQRMRAIGGLADGSILLTIDAALWRLAPDGGWQRLDDGSWPGPFIAAREAADGRLALAGTQRGLLLLATDGTPAAHLRADPADPQALPDDSVRELLWDDRGRLWIATRKGLARLDPDGRMHRWRHDPADPMGLPADRQVSLLQTRDGLIWTGSWTGGLARHDPETEVYGTLRQRGDPQRTLPHGSLSALAADPDGSLWLGLNDGGGLLQHDPQAGLLTRYAADPADPRSPSGDQITSLYHDGESLWIGYARGAIDRRLADGSFQRLAVGEGGSGLPERVVQAIRRANDGSVWVGLLSDGVYWRCPDCATFRAWQLGPQDRPGPPGESINAILQTADGRLWFAIRRGGLFWHDPARGRSAALSTSSGSPRLAHESTTALHEDRVGRLWVGSQGGGLGLLRRDSRGDPVEMVHYGQPEGLVSPLLGAILEGPDGMLWVSSTRGLCRFDPDLARFDCPGRRMEVLATDFYVGSAAADTRGRLHFGGAHGLVSVLDPGGFRRERHGLPLLLTDLRLANRRVAPGGELLPRSLDHLDQLRLRHDQDYLGIEFAAIDLRGAQHLDYRYRLLGRDAEWLQADADRRIAGYTGLAAGRYLLEVEALDQGERVGFAQLPIRVDPAPWFAPAARLAYVLLLLGALAWLWWRRQLRQRDRQRAREELEHREALLHYALWGAGAELWDADMVSGALRRRNRLEHLAVNRDAADDTLAAYTPFVHGDDRESFSAAMRQCMRGDSENFECSYRTLDLDGSWRWMLSRGKAYTRDASGRALRLVGTTFDISELRASEAALRASEERLKLALWGSGDEMWDIDLANGAIRRENPLLQTALEPELHIPRLDDYLEYVHPEDRQLLRDTLIAHIKGQSEHFECSYRVRHRDQGWVWILGMGRVVSRDESGRARRMTGTNRDVSQLKQAEDALRALNEELELRVSKRTEALEQANLRLTRTLEELTRTQQQLVESEKLAALGGLVAGVAHEINTPLGIGVTAASHLQVEARALRKRLAEGALKRSELDAFVEQAEQSCDLLADNLRRASQLVGSFKQVAVDQSSEQRRAFDLRQYLEEVLLSLRPRLRKSHVEVLVDCPADLRLDTFPGALYQMLVNLVINSLVHGFGEEGRGCIRIAVCEDGETVRLDYADDGQGMTEAVRRRVFEPFFTTRRGAGGSGLGLHIVYNLATQVLRGSLSCESAPGAGCRFRLCIPKVAPAVARPVDSKETT